MSKLLISLLTCCSVLTAICLLPTAAWSQTATATLSGTIQDANGAVIPGVALSVVNEATSFERNATTNDSGSFTVPLLPPGKYTVTARRDGFTAVKVPDVILNVGDQKAMVIQLKVGDVSAAIEVRPDENLISTSPEVSTTVDRQFVANMPLNGRSFQSLIALTPGVVLTKSDYSEQGQFSANGQRGNANYFTIDGVSANIGASLGFNPGQGSSGSVPGFSATGGTNNLVSIDALEEFKIQTSTYAPEFGRSPGAQVQIVTRSGTKDYRGTLFEYFRNDALDANDWFNNSLGLGKPSERQNDFGGVFGGPIVRKRTFFFFSYEGLRLRQPQTRTTDVPSTGVRQGAPAAIQPFLNAFPVPDPRAPVSPTGTVAFSATYSDPLRFDATSIRVDHYVGTKLTFFGRYNYAPSESIQRAIGGWSLNTLTSSKVHTQTLTFGATWFMSSSMNNEFRANYSRNQGTNTSSLDDFGGAVVPPDSILFPSSFTQENAELVFAAIVGRNVRLQVGKNVSNLQRQINFVDNLTLQAGNHQIKFGVDYRRLSPFYDVRPYDQIVVFLTPQAAAPSSPDEPGTMLSGRPLFTSVDANDPNTVYFNNFSAFAQDTWRVTPRFIITYGLRWEVNPAPTAKNPLLTVNGLENLATGSLAPLGTRLYETTYGNFSPRFGLAYQLGSRPGRELILRGGFGVFYDLGSGILGNSVNSFPYVRTKNFFSTPYPLDSSQAAPPPFSIDPPFGTLTIADRNLKMPKTYQWNASVQRSIGNKQSITVSYVGAAGRDLLRQEAIYPEAGLKSDFTELRVTRNLAISDYNALQAQYQRRMSSGLQALASYTWSKSLDTTSNDSTFNPPGATLDPGNDRGPSDFDVRHAFTGAISYEVPVLHKAGFARVFLRDWGFDTTFTARSATPVDVTSFRDSGANYFSLRPDLIPGEPLYLDDLSVPGGRRINFDAFSVPTELRQGTLGRNVLRGFPVYQVDFVVRRQFNFSEKRNLQFRAEFFNIFNHPNFGDPSGYLDYGRDAFGVSSSMLNRSLGRGGSGGGFSPLYQIGGPRSIQLALRIQF